MKIIPFFIPHQGCTNQCVFCNQHRISGALRQPTQQEIEERIIDWTKAKPGQWEVAFFGGSFTALSEDRIKYFLTPAREALKNGIISAVRLSTIPSAINHRICNLLKEYGVTTVELGVQSTDTNVLLKSGRYYTKDDVIYALQVVKDNGMKTGVQIMPGLPGDTIQTIENTVEELIKSRPDIARIYPTLVIPETTLCEMYQGGDYQPLSLTDAVKISLWAKGKFESSFTKVIRVGLMLSDVNTSQKPVAGPYHPAFHTLVKTELFKRMAVFLLEKFRRKEVVFCISPKSRDSLSGYKKENFLFLKDKYGIETVTVQENKMLSPSELLLISNNGQFDFLSVTQADITSVSLQEFIRH